MPDEIKEPEPLNETKEPEPPKCYTLLEYLLFKIDRTAAILGIIFIAALCTWVGYKLGAVGKDLPESVGKILALFFNTMGLYLGFRLGSK